MFILCYPLLSHQHPVCLHNLCEALSCCNEDRHKNPAILGDEMFDIQVTLNCQVTIKCLLRKFMNENKMQRKLGRIKK